VVGVGAIGRQVAEQLAAVGVPYLELVDHDDVAIENLAPQGYFVGDIGRHKVDATAELCSYKNTGIHIEARMERYRASMVECLDRLKYPELAVFACVDSIDVRRHIWETARRYANFFVDGRMNAEVLRVLACDMPSTNEYYETTLFTEGEAFVGSCTSRSTVYTSAIAAGMMVGQWTRWLRKLTVYPDTTFNMMAMDMIVTDPPLPPPPAAAQAAA
jgi:sulfur carrier protein ThiS adenylyltransferase